jgi:Asp-tRNA(Asn)/Glu-tRNA(Gln) amidotransferase A subunit family amidase
MTQASPRGATLCSGNNERIDRRNLLRSAPAGLALLATELGAQEAPAKLTAATLKEALRTAGLEFKEEHLAMMLPNLERSLQGLSALRALPVPLDTDPAFRFDPVLPGMKLRKSGVFAPTATARGAAFRSAEELAFRNVTELAPLVRARRITSVALTKMYLERLKRFGPGLHCTVTLTEDLALEQAARADRDLRRGLYLGPLHGIPYGAKDLFATKGIKTTWGAEPFRDQLLDYNATIIDKLDKAGAVLCAKLSMGALALGGQWFGGMTRNPWNTEKTSSGSSAGSASATAAGLVGFSIGTETLGSILTPSRICGVTGLRPTFGRVSRHGAMSLCWTMDKIGPICRGVEDAMLVLRAIQGTDGKDLTVREAPLAWSPVRGLAGLRIGYVPADFEKLTGDRKTIAEDALGVLKRAGAAPKPLELPKFPVGSLLNILNAEAAAAFDDLTRDGGVEQLSGQRPSDWPNSFRSARLITAVDYIRSMRARTLLMREMEKLLAEIDVIVGPSSSQLLTITNLTGHPQIGVPAGFVNGEPEAIHFTANLYEEGAAARAAKVYQDLTKWHRQQPAPFRVS